MCMFYFIVPIEVNFYCTITYECMNNSPPPLLIFCGP